MKAPAYSWTCHLCGASNLPGTDVCARCHFAAHASARDIASRKEQPRPPSPAQPATNLELFIALAFAIYFIAGGTAAFIQGNWPIFLPPQLDIVGLLFNSLPKPLAGYISGVFLSSLGGILLVGVAIGFWKQKRNMRTAASAD